MDRYAPLLQDGLDLLAGSVAGGGVSVSLLSDHLLELVSDVNLVAAGTQSVWSHEGQRHETMARTARKGNEPSGHQVRVVENLDERLDGGALLGLGLAHGACDLARVAVDADNCSDEATMRSTHHTQHTHNNKRGAPMQKPNLRPSLPWSNVFTITPLRPAYRPANTTTTLPLLRLATPQASGQTADDTHEPCGTS